MVSFTKFIPGPRNSQILLDTDGYTYCRRKQKDSSLFTVYRCTKHSKLKCNCHVYFTLSEDQLTRGTQPHCHDPEPQAAEKREFRTSLKRKAADQHLSSTQNLITETLKSSTPELNRQLPKFESMARMVQRSRADECGSAQFPEAGDVQDFVLPPTCYTTHRGEQFVLFDGFTDEGSRMIIFTTDCNIQVLEQHPNWISDGKFK